MRVIKQEVNDSLKSLSLVITQWDRSPPQHTQKEKNLFQLKWRKHESINQKHVTNCGRAWTFWYNLSKSFKGLGNFFKALLVWVQTVHTKLCLCCVLCVDWWHSPTPPATQTYLRIALLKASKELVHITVSLVLARQTHGNHFVRRRRRHTFWILLDIDLHVKCAIQIDIDIEKFDA